MTAGDAERMALLWLLGGYNANPFFWEERVLPPPHDHIRPMRCGCPLCRECREFVAALDPAWQHDKALLDGYGDAVPRLAQLLGVAK